MIPEAIELLNEICEDQTVPKNIRSKIKNTVIILKEEKEDSLKIDQSLQELDELSDDPNLTSYTRSQIWNVVSILESIK
ncbi:MAG: UPF0147 family protein [Candidatus Nanoarchaeia archaeon]|nr:UPF0147 family protein [Candidatus Nanoarchaeia archaeon]